MNLVARFAKFALSKQVFALAYDACGMPARRVSAERAIARQRIEEQESECVALGT